MTKLNQTNLALTLILALSACGTNNASRQTAQGVLDSIKDANHAEALDHDLNSAMVNEELELNSVCNDFDSDADYADCLGFERSELNWRSINVWNSCVERFDAETCQMIQEQSEVWGDK